MPSSRQIEAVAGQLLRAAELRRSGVSERDIAAATRNSSLVRLRQGWYISGSFWESASAETRHLAALLAAHGSAQRPPVFSHGSAALLHGFPALSRWLRDAGRRQTSAGPGSNSRVVEVTVSRTRPSSPSSTVVRHRAELAASDVDSCERFRRTTADRTIADLARAGPFTIALASADTHLSEIARVGRLIDAATVHAWRDGMLRRSESLRGRPGSRAIEAVAVLADPRADSPLESLSRLRFVELGVDVDLQVGVRGAGRGEVFLDFRLTGTGFWGEADGKQKYLDTAMLRGQTPAEIVLAEKRRTDWISGTTGLRPIRWGSAEAFSRERFGALLAAHGVRVPGEPNERWGPRVTAFLKGLP
ncbi:hypothetical protein [Leucobacter aridicollis]|uniref:hypothetical protein n=1 Tax=Leucobacter aridicollis TaxID=283878 RepID=UPI002104D19C|nr:hypothetical protein [Leucobacter aridicollis]UTX53650.1 hypothetical protein KI794_02570 [Leucobacter aridicollis]